MYSWNIVKPGIVIRIVLQWHFQQLYSLLVYLEVKENTKIDSNTLSKNNEKQFYCLSFPFQNHGQNHCQNLKMRTSPIYCRFHLFALLHHNRDYYLIYPSIMFSSHEQILFVYISAILSISFWLPLLTTRSLSKTHLVIFRTLFQDQSAS